MNWRRVSFWASGVGVILVGGAALFAGLAWMPLVPKQLGRTLTEGFLRAFLIGYASAIAASTITSATLGWIVLTDRRGLFRRRWLPRILLAGSSLLACLVVAELTATAWLAWVHRFPALPKSFAPRPTTTGGREISLVVIGGSAAMGYPYPTALSIGKLVGAKVQQACPESIVRVDILAEMGANLEKMHQNLAGLKRRPDAVIINCGNNEFLSRFESQRNAGLSEAPLSPLLGPLYSISLRSPLCRLVYETISKHRVGGKPTPVNHPKLIDPPAYTPSEFAAVLDDFRRRLDAVVSWCEQVDALPILVIPPGNLSGYEPNRNVLPDRVSPGERTELIGRFEQARGLEASEPSRAMELHRGITSRWPELAEGHFRLGRLLEAAGRWDEARTHYIAARERDGFPIRVLDAFQGVYREIAARHVGCILVDGPELFASVAPHGIVGDDFFHDAHHPTLRGQATLAEAVVRELHARHWLGRSDDATWPVTIDLADSLKRSPMDPHAWDTVCTCTATFYRDLSNIRFDPSERKARQRAYEEAMAKLKAGVPPERLGIPGMGLTPPGALPLDWWKKR